MKYLVSHQGQQAGPFTLDEIISQIRAKHLDFLDYVYDLEKDDWVLLMEFAPIAAKLKSGKPARPPQVGTGTTKAAATPTDTRQAAPEEMTEPEITAEIEMSSLKRPAAANTVGTGTTKTAATPTATSEKAAPEVNFHVAAHTITEWFVLKGENRFGPFTHTDLIRMLQQKVVYPFDFVWHTGMENWKRVAEVADFDSTNIRKMFTDSAETSKDEIFIQRRFPRSKYSGRLIIHDGTAVWRGDGVEISRGGVGVTMQNTRVLPGQQLTLHFTQQGDWPAFNAVCEVVSKKFVSDNTPVEYGLRFLSMTRETQDEFYKKVA